MKPIIEKNKNGDVTYFRDSEEYDEKGNETHYRNSDGFEEWYDKDGNIINK